ncbi:hypothetical protein LTR64_001892 [Lithohypha guttulata]|uniref:Uncharacterized protein n=1 Tax=Lithohypha guttulata TaxID=1690604 RepID=A0AAN7SU84_9EURO|nr:hypothetical protein LTR51_007751 [Lithohypha guttulata]KAK5081669.1 hypothetical protein LTR05_007802 [Lithohypha guttulata]
MAGLQDGPNQYSSQAQLVMPPPAQGGARSAPTSAIGSPNVSPPHSFAQHAMSIPSTLSPYARHEDRTKIMDINMLATAASQIERTEHDHVSISFAGESRRRTQGQKIKAKLTTFYRPVIAHFFARVYFADTRSHATGDPWSFATTTPCTWQ